MKLFDFLKRVPVIPPRPVAAPIQMPRTPKTATPVGETPEAILDANWKFRPDDAGPDGEARIYGASTIQNISAIASARAPMSIADDLEVIRKHMTRLQLVQPKPDPGAPEGQP